MVKLKVDEVLDLSKVSVRSVVGLTPEDLQDLQDLGLGSIQSVMEMLELYGGDLTGLSIPSLVVEEEQSNRIGDAILLDERVPKGFKDKFELSGGPDGEDAKKKSSSPTAGKKTFLDGLLGK